MDVAELPVDKRIVEALAKRGITRLYPPQAKAISRGVLEGKSLVIAAPTASGKTLVAELAMISKALKGAKTLYLVPLKALASEKYAEFRETWGDLDVRVALSIGDYDSTDAYLDSYHIIITTYEKADSLLRHHAPWLRSVELVVVDEIHFIDDSKRGPVLEMLLALLKDRLSTAQFLALSATIGNVEEIAEWLDAGYLYDEWRPVPLREAVYKSGKLYFSDGEIRVVRDEGGAIPSLVLDTLKDGGQALVFANSRRRAVSLARSLADKVKPYTDPRLSREYAGRIKGASESRELAAQLEKLIASGVSFHHAGLGYSERRLVEEAFRQGAVKAIVATPTLGAGVNLPARRVILDSYTRYEPGLGRVPIKAMEYKQFAGRAGRPGYDEYGEAVLIASSRDDVDELMEQYIFSGPEPIWSKLGTQSALRSHVLASIASHGADTREKVLRILGKTLYAAQYGLAGIRRRLSGILGFLEEKGFVERRGERLEATLLGRRVSELYVDPLTAVLVLEALSATSKPLGEREYLYIISLTPDMPRLPVRGGERLVYVSLLEDLGRLTPPTAHEELEPRDMLAAAKTALMLEDWVNEVDVDSISRRYEVGPGDIRAYSDTAHWILYASSELAGLKGFPAHSSALGSLHLRVRHGVKEELLELVRIPGVGRIRARKLYKAGFKSIADLYVAPPEKIAGVAGIGRETLRRILEYVGRDPSEADKIRVPGEGLLGYVEDGED